MAAWQLDVLVDDLTRFAILVTHLCAGMLTARLQWTTAPIALYEDVLRIVRMALSVFSCAKVEIVLPHLLTANVSAGH